MGLFFFLSRRHHPVHDQTEVIMLSGYKLPPQYRDQFEAGVLSGAGADPSELPKLRKLPRQVTLPTSLMVEPTATPSLKAAQPPPFPPFAASRWHARKNHVVVAGVSVGSPPPPEPPPLEAATARQVAVVVPVPPGPVAVKVHVELRPAADPLP